MKLRAAALGVVILSLVNLPQAKAIDGFVVRKIVERKTAPRVPFDSDQQIKVFKQRVDHFNSADARVFNQRFAVVTPGKKKGPVLLYQGGEANAFGEGIPSGVTAAAKELGAAVVSIEHRYYGKSQPFAQMTTENLKFLTYEQALEDTAEFQKYAMRELGLDGKWIIIGGSYSGALSAFYRLKHPELVVGSLSSSGVVREVEAFEDYDLFVARGLGESCLRDLQDANRQIEARLKSPATNAEVKKLFDSSAISDDLDFMSVVASVSAFAVQYGSQASLCQQLAQGDHVEQLASAGLTLFKLFGVTPFEMSAQGAEAVNADSYEDNVGYRQWNWQSCTQFGGFVVPYHDANLSTLSKRLDLAYALKSCERMFGLKKHPEVDRMNKDYYEPLLLAPTSNILYTSGSADPYSPLSISEVNGDATNRNTSSFVIDGGSHCTDLGEASTDSIAQAQDLFLGLAKTWLR